MPEILVKETPVQTYQIPSFLAPKMPAEFSNEPKEEKKEQVKAEPPKEVKEVKADDAPATEAKEEVKEEAKAETETTGKDQEKPEEADEKEKKSVTRRFERRMDRAIKARAEAVARAELLEKELNEFKTKAQVPKPEGAPKMEDFTDIAEYEKAVRAHERKTAEEEFQRKSREASLQSEVQQVTSHWEEAVDKALEKYDDFHEIVGDLKYGLTPWGDAVMESDNSVDVAYYLGKHEKEFERISSLSPKKQFIEIGKLSAKLQAQPETPKKPSQAPKPITPVTATTSAEPNISEPMPFEQYMKKGREYFRGR